MRISDWSSDVCSSDLRITARIDTRDERGASDPTLVTPVIDRVGTGDAFAAGVLDGLWSGKSLTDAAKHGLALAALKHGLHGDFAPFSRSMLDRDRKSTRLNSSH